MAYSGNEILTFQFGHYSNFIGTHWWNCQEAGFEYEPDTTSEIDHNVLFREGQTQRGEITFTPRLLLVDLKGSLGSLPEGGRLYETPPHPDPTLPLWPPDKVSVQCEEGQPKNDFLQDLEQGETSTDTLPGGSLKGLKEKGKAIPKLYQLEDSVVSWSDFLRPHLHPRSINVVQEYQHNDTSLPFDTFPQGHALWRHRAFNEEFTDRIRLYLEETDNLQGFQVLLDSSDGFSGLGCAGLQHLRDEYPSKSAFCVACQPPQTAQDSLKADAARVINQALTLSCLAEHASLFTPVSGSSKAWRSLGTPVLWPHVTYKPELLYHSSAIVAAAMDSFSLLYRLHSSSERLYDLTSRFSLYHRMAVALSVQLPFSLQTGTTLLDTLESWDGPLTRSLTPGTDIHSGVSQQVYVLRGMPESRIMRPEQRDLSSSNPAYSCRTLSELLRTYLLFDGQTTAHTQVFTADSALKTSAPFPNIFDKNITSGGELDGKERPQHLGVNQVPVLTGLHSSSSLGPLLESLHSEAKRVNMRSLHQFSDSGLETIELSESLEQLLCLSEAYSDNLMDI